MQLKPKGHESIHRHTSKARGTHFERRVRAYLTSLGWKVFRSAGSFTYADLIALKPLGSRSTKVLIVQCKASDVPGLAPEERAALIDAITTLHVKVLVICRKRSDFSLAYYAHIKGAKGEFVEVEKPSWL